MNSKGEETSQLRWRAFGEAGGGNSGLLARTGEVEPGRVSVVADLDESLYNPIGSVHGGVLATLLDTVIACAVQTTLPQGQAYTSLELKVSFVQKRSSVCKFAGQAFVDGKLAAEANFTAMIADPPKA